MFKPSAQAKPSRWSQTGFIAFVLASLMLTFPKSAHANLVFAGNLQVAGRGRRF
jgi:hypothetical protein